MGFVVEYELNGSNHYEAYVPTWEWDAENETDVFTYVLATPLTDNERNDILKEDGDPDADNDGIHDSVDDDVSLSTEEEFAAKNKVAELVEEENPDLLEDEVPEKTPEQIWEEELDEFLEAYQKWWKDQVF